jgi:excisionase family DNA binding protein
MHGNSRALDLGTEMDEETKKAVLTELRVPLWPTAAKALGCGRSTAYKEFAEGRIPGAYRVGNKIMVPTAALRRLLQIEEAA